jgi:hypothetical protein
MAALVVTVPRRVAIRPVDDRIVNVVPRLVALRAAPAAKNWRELADTRSFRTKDKAIGVPIPVIATHIERERFALTELTDVERPPIEIGSEISILSWNW